MEQKSPLFAEALVSYDFAERWLSLTSVFALVSGLAASLIAGILRFWSTEGAVRVALTAVLPVSLVAALSAALAVTHLVLRRSSELREQRVENRRRLLATVSKRRVDPEQLQKEEIDLLHDAIVDLIAAGVHSPKPMPAPAAVPAAKGLTWPFLKSTGLARLPAIARLSAMRSTASTAEHDRTLAAIKELVMADPTVKVLGEGILAILAVLGVAMLPLVFFGPVIVVAIFGQYRLFWLSLAVIVIALLLPSTQPLFRRVEERLVRAIQLLEHRNYEEEMAEWELEVALLGIFDLGVRGEQLGSDIDSEVRRLLQKRDLLEEELVQLLKRRRATVPQLEALKEAFAGDFDRVVGEIAKRDERSSRADRGRLVIELVFGLCLFLLGLVLG